MFYTIVLFCHSYNRWIVVTAMLFALIRAWRGMFGKKEWTRVDDLVVSIFVWTVSLQFILGGILYLFPDGLAQTALQMMSLDFSTTMKTRDLRFFGMEHPLQMMIALAIVHLGGVRSRKAHPSISQFRWAAICFTVSALLIFSAIPWWRPLLRGF